MSATNRRARSAVTAGGAELLRASVTSTTRPIVCSMLRCRRLKLLRHPGPTRAKRSEADLLLQRTAEDGRCAGRFKSGRLDLGNVSSPPDFGGELFLVGRQGLATGPHPHGQAQIAS